MQDWLSLGRGKCLPYLRACGGEKAAGEFAFPPPPQKMPQPKQKKCFKTWMLQTRYFEDGFSVIEKKTGYLARFSS